MRERGRIAVFGGKSDTQDDGPHPGLSRLSPCQSRFEDSVVSFLSGVEKRRRVAATNMNSHFIDGFARSLDIGRTAPQASSAHPVSGRSFAAF
jgi:hypothetical protein